MSREEFSDDCPGCRPAIMDVQMGKVLPPTDPMMVAANGVWDHQTTKEERAAFHRVTCLNSRQPEDLNLFFGIQRKMQAAILALNPKPNGKQPPN